MRAAVSVVAIAAVLVSACSKSSSSTSPTPDASAAPTDADWRALATQIVSLGIDALQEGAVSPSNFSPGGALAPLSRFGAFAALAVPSTTKTFNRGYLCCGASPTTGVAIFGTIVPGGLTATLTEAISINGPSLDWRTAGSTANWTLRFPNGSLQISSSLATGGGVVQPSETFKLSGALAYTASGQGQLTSMDAQVSFTDYQTGAGASGSGQIGPVAAGGSLPVPPTPTKCSLPQEGCPTNPPPNGNAPCTTYPLCPNCSLATGTCSL